jgi:hypothetical protein
LLIRCCQILTDSSGNQGSRRDTREESQAGAGSGNRGGLGLHQGSGIVALLGDFFPLKTGSRDKLRLYDLAGDHPHVIVYCWTLNVLDP